MNKPPKISIPNPCTENWTAMKPDEKGRYCTACQTSVQDFTSFSDSELISFFKQKQIPACGRLAKRQLDVLNSQDEAKSGIFKIVGKYAAAAFIGATIVPQNSVAQETVIQEAQSEPAQDTLPVIIGDRMLVKGTVVDENGNSVIACFISLKGSNINTLSDEYGKFAIEVTRNDDTKTVLSFEATGLHTEEVEIDLDIVPYYTFTVILSESAMDDIIVTGGFQTKPTFWQRITRPFRRLF